MELKSAKAKKPPISNAPAASEKSHRVEIAAIPKGQGAEIRVALDQVRKRQLVDVRLWFRPPHFNEDEPMIPTRRGITTTPETAQEVADAIQKAVDLIATQPQKEQCHDRKNDS